MEKNSKLYFSPTVRQSLMGDVTSLRRNSSTSAGKTPSSKKKSVLSLEKPHDFSEPIKTLSRRLLFKVKMYLMLNKAKKRIKTHAELSNPTYSRFLRLLQNSFRSTANSEFILEYLKPLQFFTQFIKDLGDVEDSALTELCKRIKYEYIPAGNCIFEEGAKSNDKFYVLLKGSVSVVRKVDRNVFVQENKKKDSLETIQKNGSNIDKIISQYGVKVGELKEGEGFGEKALLSKHSKRSASIITNCNCDLLVIYKEDYLDIISKYDKRRQEKFKFMKNNIPYLSDIVSSEIIENLFHHIKEVDYTKGTVLATEGSFGKTLFFVQDGFCDLEKTVIFQEKKGVYYVEAPNIKVKVATFGSGNCLGDEILTQKDSKYKYTIIVSSSLARIYYIEKTVFMLRFPRECTRAIIKSYEQKESLHDQKVKKISEDFQKDFACLKTPSLLQGSNLTHLMRPAMRHSLANHMKLLNTKAGSELSKNLSSPKISSSNDFLTSSKRKDSPNVNKSTEINKKVRNRFYLKYEKKAELRYPERTEPPENESSILKTETTEYQDQIEHSSKRGVETLFSPDKSVESKKINSKLSDLISSLSSERQKRFSTTNLDKNPKNIWTQNSNGERKIYLTEEDETPKSFEKFDFGFKAGAKHSFKPRLSTASESIHNPQISDFLSPRARKKLGYEILQTPERKIECNSLSTEGISYGFSVQNQEMITKKNVLIKDNFVSEDRMNKSPLSPKFFKIRNHNEMNISSLRLHDQSEKFVVHHNHSENQENDRLNQQKNLCELFKMVGKIKVGKTSLKMKQELQNKLNTTKQKKKLEDKLLQFSRGINSHSFNPKLISDNQINIVVYS